MRSLKLIRGHVDRTHSAWKLPSPLIRSALDNAVARYIRAFDGMKGLPFVCHSFLASYAYKVLCECETSVSLPAVYILGIFFLPDFDLGIMIEQLHRPQSPSVMRMVGSWTLSRSLHPCSGCNTWNELITDLGHPFLWQNVVMIIIWTPCLSEAWLVNSLTRHFLHLM